MFSVYSILSILFAIIGLICLGLLLVAYARLRERYQKDISAYEAKLQKAEEDTKFYLQRYLSLKGSIIANERKSMHTAMQKRKQQKSN